MVAQKQDCPFHISQQLVLRLKKKTRSNFKWRLLKTFGNFSVANQNETLDHHSSTDVVFQRKLFSINVNYDMEAAIQIHQAYVIL